MKKTSLMVSIVGVCLVLIVAVATWLMIPKHPSIKQIQLGNGWVCEIGRKSEIDPLLPKRVIKTLGPYMTLYGFTEPENKIVYIISRNPDTVISHLHQITLVFDKALDLPTPDVRNLLEYKALDEESQDVSGVMFHEIICHGSDAIDRGHLKASLSYFWPEFPAPTNETIRNPWSVIVRAWPETYTSNDKVMWKSIGQHEDWVYIPDDKYLSTFPPSMGAKDPYTMYTKKELKELNE